MDHWGSLRVFEGLLRIHEGLNWGILKVLGVSYGIL